MTSNQIAYMSAMENKRHNAATEAEVNRHNVVDEGTQKRRTAINWLSLAESQRHNKASEDVSRVANTISDYRARTDAEVKAFSAQEQQRHNVAAEEETQRSNRVREKQGWVNTGIGAVNGINNIAASVGKTLASLAGVFG